jgi:hypothetical protein
MSAEAYAPYEPLQQPKPVAPEVWIVDGPEIRFGPAALGLPFPTRMTVVRLPGGALWLHSPVPPTARLLEALRGLGEVRFLIAPNTLHYWWAPDWAERFPEARLYGAPGLRRRARRPLPPLIDLGDLPPPAWADSLDQRLVRGGVLTEAVFFHRPSRTLILTDLIENFEPSRVRMPWLRWLLRLGGAADPDGKPPIDMQLSFLARRPQLRRVVRQMIAWAPERILLAHGRWYDAHAVAELERAFRWVL